MLSGSRDEEFMSMKSSDLEENVYHHSKGVCSDYNLKLFIENEKQGLSGDIIALFVVWILRDGRHPIHLTSSVVAGCSAGSIGGLCEILKESGKEYCEK